jgi:hypothetical protein
MNRPELSPQARFDENLDKKFGRDVVRAIELFGRTSRR